MHVGSGHRNGRWRGRPRSNGVLDEVFGVGSVAGERHSDPIHHIDLGQHVFGELRLLGGLVERRSAAVFAGFGAVVVDRHCRSL